MVMAVVTAHILSPYSELEKLLPVKIHVLSLSLLLPPCCPVAVYVDNKEEH